MNTLSGDRARAKQTRRDYFQWRFKRLLGLTSTLEKPWVVGIADEQDGTLKKETLLQDLEVQVPKWLNFPTNPAFWETLQLKYSLTGEPNSYRAAGELIQVVPTNPPDPEQFPIKMAFPKELLPRDGKVWILYEHENYRGDTPVDSAPIELICDSTPPWGEQEPTFAEGPSGTVDEAYLRAHPQGIEFVLSDYEGRQESDTYKLYYLNAPPSGPGDLQISVNEGVLTDSLQVVVPVDSVRVRGNGTFYSVYTLSDKAGNLSRIAFSRRVEVELGEVPKDLLPPEVPPADDGVLDLEDVRAGINVVIQQYVNHRPEDRLAITFGGIALPEVALGSSPFPIEVPVSHDTLKAAYASATEYLNIPVSYQVLRDGASYGPAQTDVRLNFSVAGPARPSPDPTWPSPINPGLTAPTITSASGPPNEVGAGDHGEDVTLTFSLYDRIKVGQVVDFYWNGVEITEARYVHTGNARTNIDRAIPWKYVSGGGIGDIPVYFIVRGGESDALNDQESVRQSVRVPFFNLIADPRDLPEHHEPGLAELQFAVGPGRP